MLDVLIKLHADCYVSGAAADCYLEKNKFVEHNIALEYKSYDYKPYQQLYGDFIGNLSIIDLIANCGGDSYNYLKSSSPNQSVIDLK